MIQRPRLHLIDNDPEFCKAMQDQLKNYFLVSISMSGFEGYSRATSQPPDVIVLDHHMDGWSGLRTLQAIRSHSRLERVPVIMLTEDAGREFAFQTLEAGANSLILRNEVTADLLLYRLNDLLSAQQKLPLPRRKKAMTT